METLRIEDEVKPLDAQNMEIYRNELDDLVVQLPDGSKHEKVKAIRSFPLSHPDDFIVFRDKKDNEIGLIESIKQLKPKSRKVLEEELQKSYFTPHITKITNLEEKFGVSQWEVETDKGTHTFNVKNREEVRLFSSGRVLIKDADGNRYEIPDYRGLDAKSIAFLETEM